MDGTGEPKWANYNVSDIWVAPDGTVYNGSGWDEAAHELSVYKGGDKTGVLKSTHGVVDGRAITGNADYVFATQGKSFGRWSLSTKDRDGSAVDTGGQVWGLGADSNQLFVGTDANGGLIKVYNPSTMALVREWALARPGRMSVDPAGNCWVIQRGDSPNAPRAVKFSPTGTELATITFAAGVVPTDIATDGVARVLVTDNGPDQIVKIYDASSLSGTPTTVSDALGTVAGIFAVGGGFVSGQEGPGRFDGPNGTGIDSSGNYYVSTNSGGSVIESYNSSKTRLWRVFGLEFEDCGDIDPTNPDAIYTKDGKYTLNWGNGVGQEATYWGTALNPFRYPNDPRLWMNAGGNNNAGSRVVSVGGHKFLYVWDQQSVFLQVYRFDGEIAVPAALLCRGGSGVHPRIGNPSSNDSGDMWMWQDTNRDGQFDPDEYTGYRADNPYAFGWFVDLDGNVWKGMRESGIRKLTLRVDGNGMPTYSPIDVVENPVPFAAAVSGDIRRVHYDAASDTMYVTGYNSSNTQGGSTGNDDRGAGRLMARYPNWSTGNRKASHTLRLPYNFNSADIWNDHHTPESIDVAGEYMFVAYFDPGAARIRVYKSSDLEFVGEIVADRVKGRIHGTDVDTPNGINAFLRSNGEYVILQSNYGYANQLMFRWSPAEACR